MPDVKFDKEWERHRLLFSTTAADRHQHRGRGHSTRKAGNPYNSKTQHHEKRNGFIRYPPGNRTGWLPGRALEPALEQAGDNRKELEAVLEHYVTNR